MPIYKLYRHITSSLLLEDYHIQTGSQVLLWKFLYQSPCSIYVNMSAITFKIPTVRSPDRYIYNYCYFHCFINIYQSSNIKLNKVHNVRKLRIQIFIKFDHVEAEQSMESLEMECGVITLPIVTSWPP